MHTSIYKRRIGFMCVPFLCTVCVLFCFTSCNKRALSAQTRPVLGTVCTIQLFEKGRQTYYDALFARLAHIESHMSMNIPSSDIARINAAAGIEAVEVHDDTFEVIKRALYFAELTEGAFNPAAGALVKLWSIGSDNPRVPTQTEIDDTLPLCDWHSVVLKEEDCDFADKKSGKTKKTVYLTKEGTALDLGGIAKGYAADEIAKMIKSFHIKSAIVDLGGNIYAVGEKKEGAAWTVGIKNPFNSAAAPVIALSVKDVSVVTSGVYERFFEYQGQVFHHLLDYKTGKPADNSLMSVTVIHKSSMDADALATAVFIMGKERGMNLLRTQNTDGLCIDSEKNITVSPAIYAQSILLSEDFSIR
ncbi:FAD:protein FMN transferase [Treponema sp. OMZ 840]|uniref:FAD:protein FMN transferase n=1 Tax=Treponema sp. OMZ 840 TaxID=244313 RepID=UPI003D8D97F7